MPSWTSCAGSGWTSRRTRSATPAEAAAGNLIARVPGRGDGWLSFFSHLDTVPHEGPIEVVRENGAFRTSGDTILGADNKAAVTVLMELAARHIARPGAPGAGAGIHGRRGGRAAGRQGARHLDAPGAVWLRPRPRHADRRADRRGADLQAADRRVHRPRGSRRDQPGGRPQRDRRCSGRCGGDEAGAPRRGDHRERRDHRGRHGLQRRCGALPDPRRGAERRRRASRGDDRGDGGCLHLGGRRAGLRRRCTCDRDVPRLPARRQVGAGQDRLGGAAADGARAGAGRHRRRQRRQRTGRRRLPRPSCSPTGRRRITLRRRWSRRRRSWRCSECARRRLRRPRRSLPRRAGGRSC